MPNRRYRLQGRWPLLRHYAPHAVSQEINSQIVIAADAILVILADKAGMGSVGRGNFQTSAFASRAWTCLYRASTLWSVSARSSGTSS